MHLKKKKLSWWCRNSERIFLAKLHKLLANGMEISKIFYSRKGFFIWAREQRCGARWTVNSGCVKIFRQVLIYISFIFAFATKISWSRFKKIITVLSNCHKLQHLKIGFYFLSVFVRLKINQLAVFFYYYSTKLWWHILICLSQNANRELMVASIFVEKSSLCQ